MDGLYIVAITSSLLLTYIKIIHLINVIHWVWFTARIIQQSRAVFTILQFSELNFQSIPIWFRLFFYTLHFSKGHIYTRLYTVMLIIVEIYCNGFVLWQDCQLFKITAELWLQLWNKMQTVTQDQWKIKGLFTLSCLLCALAKSQVHLLHRPISQMLLSSLNPHRFPC